MTRIATKVVVFLLLGAIVNVAVAWGCAGLLKHPTPVVQTDSDSGGFPLRMQIELKGFAVKRHGIYELVDPIELLTSRMKQGAPLKPFPLTVSETTWHHRAGLPAISLQRTEHTVIATPTAVASITVPAQLEFRLYQPVWPGFAINTIFYAAVLWMIFACFPLYCVTACGSSVACAYPVGTSPVCTECGAAVKKLEASSQKSAEAQP